jgi:hypothetical protein
MKADHHYETAAEISDKLGHTAMRQACLRQIATKAVMWL